MRGLRILFILTIGFVQLSNAQSELDTLSLEEISRKLENPLTDLWSLTFQENFYILVGNFSDQKQWPNNFFFQPFLPFPVANKYLLTFRFAFNLNSRLVLVTNDSIAESHVVTEQTC